MTFLLGAVLALLAPTSALHPTSISSSRITVEGSVVRLALRCQASTLIEVLPLDRDGNGKLADEELEAGRESIERYVLERYRLRPGSGADAPAQPPLAGRMTAARPANTPAGGLFPPEPLVDLSFRFEAERELSALRVELSLFQESHPWHRDHAEIAWNGAEPQARVLWIEDPVWTFEPESAPRGGVLGQYVSMGIGHILSGYDHIAFLVALIVASRRVRSLLGVITAFTCAHSVTLALAALGVVHLPERVVEISIALSIAYVGLRSLLDRASRRLWPEAFGFGLVHGLGFAGFLAESLAAEPQKLKALVGFNLGVEVGQLGIVIAVALALRLARLVGAAVEEERASLAPVWVRLPASAIVGGLGIYWVLARGGIV